MNFIDDFRSAMKFIDRTTFLTSESRRRGMTIGGIANSLVNGDYGDVEIKWNPKDGRRVFIRVSKLAPPEKPLPGEIRIKQFLMEESLRTGITPGAINMRISRGKYPNLRLRRVNKRVVFVRLT